MAETAIRKAPATMSTEWLESLPAATRLAFYGDAGARAAALPVWGVEFSDAPCRANAHSTRATLWLGPDEYLLLDIADDDFSAIRTMSAAAGAAQPAVGAPGAEPAASAAADAPGSESQSSMIAASLERAMAGVPHALVDISHRQFALEVRGPHAATILSGACPLDMDLAEFPIGMCTRTVLAKADIVLWRTRADAFHLEVWRSFGGYVTGVLREIASEFYADP